MTLRPAAEQVAVSTTGSAPGATMSAPAGSDVSIARAQTCPGSAGSSKSSGAQYMLAMTCRSASGPAMVHATVRAFGSFHPGSFKRVPCQVMAGPDCTFIPGCNDIGNQSLAIFEQLGRVTVRDIVVDERMGIVMMRLSWNVRGGEGSDRLTAWEAFKVWDGQIHMVEAYIRLLPPALDLGGWPVDPAIVQP